MNGQDHQDLGIPGLSEAVEVGRGGFAVVYRCHQEAFGRTVAVKVLRDAINDDNARRRFQRECLAMGMLSGHPNIVTVYDAGFRPAGDPYIVMDYMAGGSLADRVAANGPMRWHDVLPATVMLLGALHSAHEAGVLHRDIKPENVMQSSYGTIKLSDFGIARLRHGPQTRTEGLTASIPHVAPELIAGGPASVQSDLYAVGSTMFHLLSGHAAFLRDTDESILPALQRIASEPVPDLRHAGVPDEICGVIEHLMDKDPARRPVSARAVGVQVRALQRHFGLPLTHFAVAEKPPTPGAVDSAVAAVARPAPRAVPPAHAVPPAQPHSAPAAGPEPQPPPHPDVRPQPPPPPPPRGATAKRRATRPRRLGWVLGIVVVAGLATAWVVLGRGGTTTPVAQSSPGAAVSEAPDDTPSPGSSEGDPPADLARAQRLEPPGLQVDGAAIGGVDALSFLVDQRPATALTLRGDGVGNTITLNFDGPVRITRIGMIPGNASVDPEDERTDRYRTTRRVQQVRLRLGEGVSTKVSYSDDEAWDMEFVDVDVVTDEVAIDVLASSSGDVNRVAISEIEVLGGAADDLPPGPVRPLPSTLQAQRLQPAPPPPPGEDGRYAFPVHPVSRASYQRGHNAYPASDIYAPCGTAVIAPTRGRVSQVQRVDRWDPLTDLGPDRGGIFVTLIGNDGVRYFISHLADIARGLSEGDEVAAGALIGTVGESGTARDTPCHIHLGFSRPGRGPQDWRPRRGIVDPYPYLEAWRSGRERSPAREVRRAPLP